MMAVISVDTTCGLKLADNGYLIVTMPNGDVIPGQLGLDISNPFKVGEPSIITAEVTIRVIISPDVFKSLTK